MKVLFWDLDHTLWDFKKNSREALAEGYDEFNLDTYGISDVEQYIESYEKANSWCWKEYREGRMEKSELRGRRFKMAMEPWGLSSDLDLSEKLGQHYIQSSPFKTNLFEGSIEVLTELKKRGHRMVILTNGFDEVQYIKVDKSGLAKFFEQIITSDSIGFKKPHPQAFQISLEKVGVDAKDVVMIGDDLEADILGAKSVGLGQIFFNPYSHSHNETVDYEVKTLSEILSIALH